MQFCYKVQGNNGYQIIARIIIIRPTTAAAFAFLAIYLAKLLDFVLVGFKLLA